FMCSISSFSFSFSLLRSPITLTLFPYTTLFRSLPGAQIPHQHEAVAVRQIHIEQDQIDLVRVNAHDAVRERRQRVLRVARDPHRSEEHTSELQSRFDLVCRLLLEKKKNTNTR